jgi:hypothetical protein
MNIHKLAQALKDSKPIDNGHGSKWAEVMQWNNTVETIAMTLQHDSKSFDKARFLNACGYNS